jgi:hypothetical protein
VPALLSRYSIDMIWSDQAILILEDESGQLESDSAGGPLISEVLSLVPFVPHIVYTNCITNADRCGECRRVGFRLPSGVSRPVIDKVEAPHFADDSSIAIATLTFDIDETGRPNNIQIEKTSDEDWASSVTAVLRKWKFTPASKDGSPVSVPCTMDFVRGNETTLVRQDPEAIRRNVTALVRRADEASASNRNAEAEDGYQKAVRECEPMPPDQYHCKTGVLWSLGRFYSHVGEQPKAEAVYKQRIDILHDSSKAPYKAGSGSRYCFV